MNFSKRKPSARLLFTDTKSWVYKIRTDDVHKDFYEDKNSFDFSNYPGDSIFLTLLINK